MKIGQFQKLFNLEVAAGEKGLDHEVKDGYCGDLLSDVMANSTQGTIWLTIQRHQNIVAVAVLKEMAAIVLVNGRQPEEETKAKADEEGMPILLSPLPAFKLAGLFYKEGTGAEVE
ncbi:MAG: serine kinase [Thermodesulfobacteriota bacterium]|nr:serine kinase [Thermodesulfobacteriota bacterium]